jgi:3-oxoacyl-[acyl-carrier-protein] synthase III
MSPTALLVYLSERLGEVQERLGLEPSAAPDIPFADLVDSMGLVEFVGRIAADCGVPPETVERAVNRRFSTVAELARALHAAGIVPHTAARQAMAAVAGAGPPGAWLAAWHVSLPATVQDSEDLDRALGRPPGWLGRHAGICGRRVWAGEDALEAAASAGRRCLEHGTQAPAALLVTGEAPPRLVGLAAALHARLGLAASVPALEVGGACTGLLHALWLGRHLLRSGGTVPVLAVEAPSSWLAVAPGTEGEAAALFGDAAAGCLLAANPTPGAWPILDVVLGCDGHAGELVQVDPGPVLRMDGPALALRAVQQLAAVVAQVCDAHALKPADLEGVYIHAGNGRLPALVAQQLGVPARRVHSTTATTGNLGSVSLLAALAQEPPRDGPLVCAAVGAGLCWGAALLGPAARR